MGDKPITQQEAAFSDFYEIKTSHYDPIGSDRQLLAITYEDYLDERSDQVPDPNANWSGATMLVKKFYQLRRPVYVTGLCRDDHMQTLADLRDDAYAEKAKAVEAKTAAEKERDEARKLLGEADTLLKEARRQIEMLEARVKMAEADAKLYCDDVNRVARLIERARKFFGERAWADATKEEPTT